MNPEERLRETVDAIDEQIKHIAKRPGMYVGGDEHLHAAEVMVRLLLRVRDSAVGRESVSRSVDRTHIYEKYPNVPGPVRSVTTGCREYRLDFETELLDYVEWYNSL